MGTRNRTSNPTGFTLVELLVVIAVIGLLASILLPSLANAREMAKAAACLSNMKNCGTGLMMYQSDNRTYYPTAYSYIDGVSSAGGYSHWSAALTTEDYTDPVTAKKYPKNAAQFVCPSQFSGGWAPSNFTVERIPTPPPGQVAQSSTLDDKQAPRMSYTANEVLMPRKKYSAAQDLKAAPGTSNLCLVSADEVHSATNTILLAEFSSSANCIYGSSVGGGAAYKSHRPTNAVKLDGGGVFDGENYTPGGTIFKLTLSEAQTAIDAVLADRAAGATNHHISYINPNAHKSGSNYTFADGHAAKYSFGDTLDQGNYMWGRKVYSCVDKPVIRDNP